MPTSVLSLADTPISNFARYATLPNVARYAPLPNVARYAPLGG
jgi:hypothetical protein